MKWLREISTVCFVKDPYATFVYQYKIYHTTIEWLGVLTKKIQLKVCSLIVDMIGDAGFWGALLAVLCQKLHPI